MGLEGEGEGWGIGTVGGMVRWVVDGVCWVWDKMVGRWALGLGLD